VRGLIRNKDRNGIVIGNKDVKLPQYTNNTHLSLNGTEANLENILEKKN